jgi:hypothetical protein
MKTQKEIILACTHALETDKPNVKINGEDVRCCTECWNQSVVARKAIRKAELAEKRAEGVAYWTSRGIAIGETVTMLGQGMLGPVRVFGTAKSGGVGAYVASKVQRGMLAPECWSKQEEQEKAS